MSLDVDLVAHAGAFRVDAAFSVAPGEVLAILGPNGSGKSTLLAAIAGHLRATTGALSLDGTGILASVPPEQRRIGLLGQRAMLFPHLSARENVAFGPRAQGLSARAARERADRWLAEVGMGDLARRRPAQLSGGQQQRVALARSLAAEPGALLLDEPFASLDAQTGTSARRIIARLRDRLGIPMIVVTHDALDAVMLAARTVVIDGGRIVQQGATAEVLGHPRSRFAAAIAGVNLVTGAGAAEGALRADAGMLLHGRGDRLREGESGSAVFAPAAVRIAADAPLTGAPSANSWRGTVSVMEATRGGVRLFTEEHPHLAVECPPGIAASLGIRPGLALALSVSPDDVSLRREPPASL